jgi:hypothetical protein
MICFDPLRSTDMGVASVCKFLSSIHLYELQAVAPIPTRGTPPLLALSLTAAEYLSQKICARKPLISIGNDARQVFMTACRNTSGKKEETTLFRRVLRDPPIFEQLKPLP